MAPQQQLELLPVCLRHWLTSRALVAGLALACFANSCWGNFVFDDSEAIINNNDVDPGATSISQVFSHDFWGSNISLKTSHKSYRPLTVLTFRWTFWLAGGRHSFLFHLFNVLLHPLVCLLLMDVITCWSHDYQRDQKKPRSGRTDGGYVPTVPLITALLFAVHPIHTESVAGVVGRAELTSALCFMAALLTYSHCCSACGAGKMLVSLLWLLFTLLLAGCAMLFKEQGITVLGVCFTYDIIQHTKLNFIFLRRFSWSKVRGLCVRLAVLSTGAALLLWGRYMVMCTGAPQFKPMDNPPSFADSLLTRVLSYNYLYALNMWLLFHPWWLCFDWSMGCVPLVSRLSDPRVLAAVIFWTGLVCLLGWTICRLHRPKGRLVALSISLLVLPFLPASNLFFRVGFVLAERVLYLPSAGYCLLIALGVTTLASQSTLMNRVVVIFLLYLTTMFVWRSVHRSSQWLTEESLFKSGAQVCPLNAKVHYNIGKVMADTGQQREGEAHYREAVRLYPEYDQALNNLGNLLKESNRLFEAEIYLERALQSNPEFAAAWMNLGIVQAALNKTTEAEVSYKRAITHRKKYPDAYYNLGNLYIDTGQYTEAIVAFKTAISLQKDHSNAWTNLGLLYENLKMYTEAEATLREAIRIMPDNPRFYFSLGVLFGKIQRLEEGKEYLTQAVKMRPDAANYHVNLGVIYHMQNMYDKAMECYQTGLQLDPTLAIAQENLKKLHTTMQKLRQ